MRYSRAVMVTATAVGAFLVPSSAVAQITSISMGQARLGPQGASVSLPVTVGCEADWNLAFGTVSVLQSTGHKLAQGSGSFFENFPGIPCASPITNQTTVADSSSFAFKQGKATATANVEVFNPTTASFFDETVSQSIRISKKAPIYVDPFAPKRK